VLLVFFFSCFDPFNDMTVITVMYILIGMRLRKTEIGSTSGVLSASAKNTATRARKAVLKMLGKYLEECLGVVKNFLDQSNNKTFEYEQDMVRPLFQI
jgi:hypothetical protein